MIFSYFLQWRYFILSADLKKHPRKIFPLQFLGCSSGWGCKCRERKENANNSPHVFPGNVAWTGTCQAQKYRRQSIPELFTNYHLNLFSSSIANMTFLCPECSLTTKTGKTCGKSKESPIYLICPQQSPWTAPMCGALLPHPLPWNIEGRCPWVWKNLLNGHCKKGSAHFWVWDKCRLSREDPFWYRFQKVCFLHQQTNNESLAVTWEKMRLQRMYK